MTDLPYARRVLKRGEWAGAAAARVLLDHRSRLLRRRRLETESGEGFLSDLPGTVDLDEGDAIELADGRLVEVVAAPEAVLVLTGSLARAAWHIGNRHAPCQIEDDRLVIRHDPDLEQMLRGLGVTVSPAMAPFRPERGAHGHGCTPGHDQPEEHGHPHVHLHVSRPPDEDDAPDPYPA